MGFLKEIFRGFTMSTDDLIAESNKEIAKSIKEKEGLNYKHLLYYNNVLGIEGMNSNSTVSLFDDRLRFGIDALRKKDVLFRDIKSIEIMNSIQIEEKSKVGQMMVIGLFALATKKKTEEIMKNKLVINVSEEGINYSIVVETIYDTIEEAKKLNKILLEYKSCKE